MSDKFDFIRELLKNKKLSQIQRDRIFDLAAREISHEGTLEERIQKIEDMLYEEPVEPGITPPINSLNKYIYPASLYKFLLGFNQNQILRSTCHDIDSDAKAEINQYCNTEEYNFSIHLQRILEEYSEFEKKHFAPHGVKSLIRGYLTGKNYKGIDLKMGWSSDKIQMNWSHSKLISWAIENPNTPPNTTLTLLRQQRKKGVALEGFNSGITGKRIQTFTDLVLHFKHLFHIRADNSLRDIIERKNKEEGWDDLIEFEILDEDFPKNIEFFTDVDKLMQAYKVLIELIIKQNKIINPEAKPHVKISLFEEDNSVVFSINHTNGIYGKTIQNTIERGIGQTYRNLINKQINGMCNLFLQADFGNGNFAKINLWDSKTRSAITLESFKGVEHSLEFPKK